MRFTPAALASADVWKIVVSGTFSAADTITLTVGLSSIVLTLGATVTNASIATALMNMWNGGAQAGDATVSQTGDNVPQMAEATATIGATTATVLFTMGTAGRPMVLTKATSGSGVLTLTNPTVATGPKFWSDANNWSGGAVPTTGDTARLDNCNIDISYGLAQSAVTLAALYIDQSYTGSIGLPERNAGADYEEYRAQYLAISATVLQIGAGPGSGSGRIKINTGVAPAALTVFASGSPLEADLPAVIWKGTGTTSSLVQSGGSVGAAVFGGELAQFATVKKVGGDLLTGPGVTLSGALQQDGGTWQINSPVAASLTQTAGSATINGTGAVAQLTVQGGTVTYNTTGTLGGATILSGNGVLDFTGNNVAMSCTNPIDLFGQQCFLNDATKRLGSVVVDFNQSANQTQANFGLDFRLTRGATA